MRMTPINYLTLLCLFPVKQLVGRDFKTLLPFGAKSYTVILGAVMNWKRRNPLSLPFLDLGAIRLAIGAAKTSKMPSRRAPASPKELFFTAEIGQAARSNQRENGPFYLFVETRLERIGFYLQEGAARKFPRQPTQEIIKHAICMHLPRSLGLVGSAGEMNPLSLWAEDSLKTNYPLTERKFIGLSALFLSLCAFPSGSNSLSFGPTSWFSLARTPAFTRKKQQCGNNALVRPRSSELEWERAHPSPRSSLPPPAGGGLGVFLSAPSDLMAMWWRAEMGQRCAPSSDVAHPPAFPPRPL